MKKIFGFIGSPHNEKSNTYTIAKMLCEGLIEMDNEISYELIGARDIELNFCRGCWTCMTKGFCPLDKKDSMASIKQKMLEADMIIMGSPVYCNNVSGQFKTYIDRLVTNTHVLKFSGKIGVSVVTTGKTYRKELHELIEPQMKYLGIIPVARLDAIGFTPGVLENPQEAECDCRTIADHVYPYLIHEKMPEPDEFIEEYFQYQLKHIHLAKSFCPYVYNYWKDNNIQLFRSFKEYLHSLKNKNIPLEECI